MKLCVDNLGGKTFTVIVSSKDRPVNQPRFFDTGLSSQAIGIAQSASRDAGVCATTGGTQPVCKATGAKATGALKKTGDSFSDPKSSTNENRRHYIPIPDTEEVYKALKSQMDALVKLMKGRRQKDKGYPPIIELLRTEFGKDTDSFTLVSTVRALTELSESVCIIKAGNPIGTLVGTGFLLFGNCILTCAHVVEQFISSSQSQTVLTTTVHINFKYEKHGESLNYLLVKPQIVAYDRELDYALLELVQENSPLPPALITNLGVPPKRGGVCIIGHPDGGVKKIDMCSIIKFEERQGEIQEHHYKYHWCSQLITRFSFEEMRDEKRLSYNTCFYHTSSGSPVFNDQGQLVAVHTGGNEYKLKIQTASLF
ncbi:LOW QUALITY PROTEIN: serine protease FAM111A-like [Polyodon spathula]|uniref:LOW QUALITY PROTEIN: serine protease FAM111A-like n=1 Tax=Polyodon spathula TaxID=7913 RepID=UPI001B7DE4C1|nr:LOW QUALITY PROTEIN: serine protease FAM111A-like [Polyodon spathula]